MKETICSNLPHLNDHCAHFSKLVCETLLGKLEQSVMHVNSDVPKRIVDVFGGTV